jgi:hypothetical protein
VGDPHLSNLTNCKYARCNAKRGVTWWGPIPKGVWWSAPTLTRPVPVVLPRDTCLSSSYLEKKKKLFNFSTFQLFNLLKRRRLRASLLLASLVLVSRLSLFRYCLFSISSFSFSFLSSLSFSSSSSFSSSAWDWISSMNSVFYLWINHLVMYSRHLHLNALKSWRFSCRRVLKSLLSSIKHLHLNILHLHLYIHILRIFQSSSVLCFLRTITRSRNLWFLHV